jgi:hypothetical protein
VSLGSAVSELSERGREDGLAPSATHSQSPSKVASGSNAETT